MIKPKLSVIICTHNPRENNLSRVLGALSRQTLAREQWELLLIDNASSEPLAKRWNVAWLPQSRIVREDELGLTPARLRGIREARSELLIFVDDDNVLDPDYLENSLSISEQFPTLGAWGGQNLPEFERPPEDYESVYLPYLACRRVEQDRWSNFPYYTDSCPFGAGLCVRTSVAAHYAAKIASDPMRVSLDRCGQSLLSGGDIDLALTSVDLGLGCGVFKALKLIHIIPASRIEEKQFFLLVRKIALSNILLASIHPRNGDNGGQVKRRTLFLKLLKLCAYPSFLRRVHFAALRGEIEGRRFLRQIQSGA